MMTKDNPIYILAHFTNQEHLQHHPTETEDEYVIRFSRDGCIITLSETNSLVEDRYSMNIHSAQYLVEGKTSKEAMIHHHPKGHQARHLQFRLSSEHKVLRIIIDPLDQRDYERCIRGFLSTAKKIIEFENEEHGIQENLVEYFFNEEIGGLEYERRYLLKRIQMAFKEGSFLDDDNKPLSAEELETLRKEPHLLPFLEWE